jgi:hypothetical protein
LRRSGFWLPLPTNSFVPEGDHAPGVAAALSHPPKGNMDSCGNHPRSNQSTCLRLFNTSSSSTAFGMIRTTRYRRSTISPSFAMNTSSSFERKAFLASPIHENPKNFSRIGGGKTLGGSGRGGSRSTTLTLFTSTSARKMFRPRIGTSRSL